MKKIVFALALATILVACGGNGASTEAQIDSTAVSTDTTAVVADSTVKADSVTVK
jgi:ABC-type glycerol-3-phosphate transport system substrate-binding protein